MHDLPIQGRLQQQHARSISGEELEALGKKAAAVWVAEGGTLTDAVVETVKHAGLSPEQVCRVIEFTNTEAYLNEFRKEGSTSKVIEFAGGPADPSAVLKDLNDGGGGTVFDRGMSDYSGPPAESSTKTSSAAEEALYSMLRRDEVPMAVHNPLSEAIDMREKLASMRETFNAQLTGLEVMYEDLSRRLYGQVKQAALNGTTLGEIVRAWSHAEPDPEYVKIAFSLLTPKLLDDGVFSSLDSIGASLEKTGSVSMVNFEHPLIQDFSEWSQALCKLAETREALVNVEDNLEGATRFLVNPTADIVDPDKTAGAFSWASKKVAPLFSRGAQQVAQEAVHQGKRTALSAAKQKGLIPSVADVFEAGSKPVRAFGHGVGGALFGEGTQLAQATGDIAGGLVQYAPHAAGAAGAYRLYQHLNAFGDSPIGQKLRSFIPGTPQNTMVKQELDARYNGQVPYFATGPFVSY